MYKFISYSGRYPNLCSGVLKLEISGKIVTFGDREVNGIDSFEDFWRSGGSCNWRAKTDAVTEAPWEYNGVDVPFDTEELMYVFNKNVPHGCCGGCL